MTLPRVQQTLFLQLLGTLRKCGFLNTVIIKPLPSFDPTSYQLRKHLSYLLHMKQLGARDMDRWNRECMALLLQVWRKELEITPSKTITVSRTAKNPSKSSSGTKPTRHSVLKQIYGKCPTGHLQFTSTLRVSRQNLKWDLITLSKPHSGQVGTLLYFKVPREFSAHLVPPFYQFWVRVGLRRHPGISTQRTFQP